MQILNIFHSGGLWLLPFAMLIAALYFFYLAYKQSKSGSTIQKPWNEGGQTVSSTENVPMYKQWSFLWACLLLACAIAAFIIIGNDYKGV